MTQTLARSLLSCIAFAPLSGTYARVPQPFTVAEEIGLAHFGDPYTAETQATGFSPDGNYFAAHTERGRLDLNRPEAALRIYRTQDVLGFLGHPQGSPPPPPVWTFRRSTADSGPIITHWRWLADSSGIAYLERGTNGSNRLVLAELKQKTIEPLTPHGQTIKAFDIRDRNHYVYALADLRLQQQAMAERKTAAVLGTGRALTDLLFPADQNPQVAAWADRSELWAVVDGKRFQIKDQSTGRPVVLFEEGQRKLVLSPNGRALITAVAIPEIPAAWESRYPPPFAAYPYHPRAGRQDLQTSMGQMLASEYVRIELHTGRVQSLLNAPTGMAAGWFELAPPAWSRDGEAVLLADTFGVSAVQAPSRPCAALVNFVTHAASCIESLKGPTATGYEKDYRLIKELRFASGDKHRVIVNYDNMGGTESSTEYQQEPEGAWIAGKTAAVEVAGGGLEVTVKQGLNEPPVLMATDSKTKVSWTIFDPNPQLKDIALGEATVYQWRDRAGRDWKGGLFKAVPYETGHRYPLVIQTHGFVETQFRPSGIFPTAFAARALAGAGLVVLQVQDCPIYSTPEEGPCNVDGYEAAVSKLVKDGLVDAERIGIIGFSRTCFDVMEALTATALHIKAAAITDGVMADYLQYLMSVDLGGNVIAHDYDAIIGARPFGMGLPQWLQRSPLFNIDKVNAPLLVVAEGRPSLLSMWAPYAALRYLRKPTELMLLHTSEHVLTNPEARMASQGGSVEWFRFWLQGYEDPARSRADQYKRWRELRALQEIPGRQPAGTGARHPKIGGVGTLPTK